MSSLAGINDPGYNGIKRSQLQRNLVGRIITARYASPLMKIRGALLILVLSLAGTFAQPGGKPQYGTWGFDSEGADLKTKPGDDFFRHANGAWLDRVQIPADKSAYSLRLAMTDLTEQRLHDLMEETSKKAEPKPTTIEGKIGAFYKSFMDEARIEKIGAGALKSTLP